MFLKRFLFSVALCLLVISTNQAQKKKVGRSPEKEIKVPEGFAYQVLNYRIATSERANQVAITYKEDGLKNKPVVVFIHGGGWAKGDKQDTMYQAFQVAKEGFVGVTVSYSLISEAAFPTCIYDVKEAIRFIKSKADEWPVDVNRIGVWGYSAGAHLALMVGLSPESEFKSDLYSKYDSKVKSLMVVSAPTDFVTRVQKEGDIRIFDSNQNKNIAFQKAVSPLTYVDKNQLPIFMLHGDADPLVKPYHYKKFKNLSKEKKVSNFQLFEFENGGHMFYFKNKKEVQPIFEDFLKNIRS